MTDFRLGDVVEFRDRVIRKGKWESDGDNLVGRVSSITKNEYPLKQDEHEFEIWLEYYGEMAGRMYIIPSDIIRTIEKGKTPFIRKKPKFSVGTHVFFMEKEKRVYDMIIGFEFTHESCGQPQCYYKLKYSGYSSYEEEFEVIK